MPATPRTEPALPETAQRRSSVQRWVFWPAAVIVLAFSGFALVAPHLAEVAFGAIQSTIVNAFNWYYVLIAAFFVAFALFLGFSRYGHIRLGADGDRPEFSLGAWFSLLFAAGMGIGLVFYGVSEPLSHYATPPPGATGTPEQLAQAALSQTYLHWGVQAWSIYVVVGLGLAYAIHRRKRPVSVRWALEPLLGRRVNGRWGNAIDVVALVGTLFGVATSLGLGVLQISAGLDFTGILTPTRGAQVGIIGIITVFVLFSVLSGVRKGMKWLSSLNLILAGLLLLYLLIFGQTDFLLREWVQSMGGYIQDFIGLSFDVSAFQRGAGESWQATWTSFYWGWWISWSPFVGIFIARISKGRTVRQFVAGVILVPTLITILWFAILGGSALFLEINQPGALTQHGGTVDVDTALFQMLAHLPGAAVLTFGALLLITIFFITSSDSGALVMGMIASGGQINPRKWVRVFFTLVTALLAVSLLLTGGLQALQTAAILIALPFSIVMLFICWATVLAFSRERRAHDRASRALLVDQIGEYYGLEAQLQRKEPTVEKSPQWIRKLARLLSTGRQETAEPTDAAQPIATEPPPRSATPGALGAESLAPGAVPTHDIDYVVEHDPHTADDSPDVPDPTTDDDGKDPLTGDR